MWFPHARVRSLVFLGFFITMTEIPSVVFLGFWFLLQFFQGTLSVAASGQAGGVAWMSGSTWGGRQAIRLSVSNWQTTEEDVDRTVAAFAVATQNQ